MGGKFTLLERAGSLQELTALLFALLIRTQRAFLIQLLPARVHAFDAGSTAAYPSFVGEVRKSDKVIAALGTERTSTLVTMLLLMKP